MCVYTKNDSDFEHSRQTAFSKVCARRHHLPSSGPFSLTMPSFQKCTSSKPVASSEINMSAHCPITYVTGWITCFSGGYLIALLALLRAVIHDGC